MSNQNSSPFRLVLWPTVITAIISIARLIGERTELISAQSGGALSPLGITWWGFLFGAWFGHRLSKAGHGPRVQRPRTYTLMALLLLIGIGVMQFIPLRNLPATTEAFYTLRQAVLMLAAVASTFAALMFVVWPRLAFTMLLYAIPARATVIAITWLAKSAGWNTHYTKFGPMGIELGMAETMISASLVQMLFWVPFTILCGCFAGSLVAKRR